jgi:tetratricopeptide (TPR) repeat protein
MEQNILNKIESLIQSGDSRSAQQMIHHFMQKTPHPSQDIILKLAHQARRSGIPLYSLKLLRPYLFFDQEFRKDTPSELRSAYGAGLISLGAVPEGLKILNNVNPAESPDSLFFSTLAYFQTWNYRKALSLLLKYLQSPKISEYQSLVGKVNLIAAFLSLDQFDEAEALIESCLIEITKNQLRLLHGNVLELKAQSLFFQKKYSEAKIFLKNSQSILESTGGFYYIYAKKWDLLAHLYDTPIQNRTTKGLEELRKLSLERGNYETLRDLDLHEGILFQNNYLLNKVYFGTPYKTYRQRLSQQFPMNFQLINKFILRGSSHPEMILDRLGPKWISGNQTPLSSPPSISMAIQILTSDIYKPTRLATFFSSYYEGQHFHPHTSPHRVFKVIRRLNLWLQENQIPAKIHTIKSSFQFQQESHMGLLFSKDTHIFSSQDLMRKKLLRHVGYSPFSIHQTEKIWPELSIRQRQRILKRATEEKILKIEGHGKLRRYIFSK